MPDVIIDHSLAKFSRLLGPELGAFLHEDADLNPTTDTVSPKGSHLEWQGAFGGLQVDDILLSEDQELPKYIKVGVERIDAFNIKPTALGVRASFEKIADFAQMGEDLREGNVAVLTRVKKIWRELAFATLLYAAMDNASRSSTPTNGWDTDDGDPVADMLFARRQVALYGEFIDGAVMGYQAFEALQNSAKLKGRLVGANDIKALGPLSIDQVRQALGLKWLKVGTVPYNPGLPGSPAASNEFIWGKWCLFVKNRKAATKMTPQSCIQRWRRDTKRPAGAKAIQDGQVRRYPVGNGAYIEQTDLLNNDQFTVADVRLGWLLKDVVA